MKTTRKIIPALVMLLVSAIMLSTASYAWFATQTTVEANSMSVKAKAEAKYLWISNNNTDWKTAAEALKKEAEVSLVTAVINKDNKDVTWYTGEGASPDSAEEKDALVKLDTIDADHALFNTFYFKADVGSVGLENLTIKSINVSDNENDYLKGALRVMAVVDGIAVQLWKPTVSDDYEAGITPGTYIGWAMDESVSDKYLVKTLEPNAVKTVVVYAYYDGEDETAFTSNANKLANASITITFSVDN